MTNVPDLYERIKAALISTIKALPLGTVMLADQAVGATATGVEVEGFDADWLGKRVRIAAGPGVGESGIVTALTDLGGSITLLTTDHTWTVSPVAVTSLVYIVDGQLPVYSQVDVDTDTSNIDYPCFVVTSAGLRRKLLDGDSETRHYEYPNNVFLLDRPGTKAHQNEPIYTGLIQMVDDALHQQRLSTYLPEVTTRVEPGATFDARLPQYQGVQSSLTVFVEAWLDR